MKRMAPLVPGMALALTLGLGSATAQAQPARGSAATKPTDTAAAQRQQLADDLAKVGNNVQQMLDRLEQEEKRNSERDNRVAEIGSQVQALRKGEGGTLPYATLALAALAALLSVGSLLLHIRVRSSLAAMERELKEIRFRTEKKVNSSVKKTFPEGESGQEKPHGRAGGAETDKKKRIESGSEPGKAEGEAGKAWSPAESPTASAPPPAKSGSSQQAMRTPAAHDGRIGTLLAQLCQEVPRLAESFAVPTLRERFVGELDAPLRARLDRLKTAHQQGDKYLRERWVDPDLIITLDTLAIFYSEAAAEALGGDARAERLTQELRAWLYDFLAPVCREEGWFDLDPIEPYRTTFNPKLHHAVTGRDVAGAQGRIIAIQSVGRRDPSNGTVIYKAEVIVGR